MISIPANGKTENAPDTVSWNTTTAANMWANGRTICVTVRELSPTGTENSRAANGQTASFWTVLFHRLITALQKRKENSATVHITVNSKTASVTEEAGCTIKTAIFILASGKMPRRPAKAG